MPGYVGLVGNSREVCMRRTTIAAVIISGGILAAPATALADPPPNDHNCAGAADSMLAGPGFGGVVSGLAQQSPAAIAILFDFANCGNNGNGL
jgi:hypothetical protein